MTTEEKLRCVLGEIAVCKKAMSEAQKNILRYISPAPGADLPSTDTILAATAMLGSAAEGLLIESKRLCDAIQPPLEFPKAARKKE